MVASPADAEVKITRYTVGSESILVLRRDVMAAQVDYLRGTLPISHASDPRAECNLASSKRARGNLRSADGRDSGSTYGCGGDVRRVNSTDVAGSTNASANIKLGVMFDLARRGLHLHVTRTGD